MAGEDDRLKISRWSGRDGEVDTLIAQMKDLHPDDLERWRRSAPSSAVKSRMEDAVFEGLLATDPERALAKAREVDAPLVSAKRLAIIGELVAGHRS